jgi:hypothetical protein
MSEILTFMQLGFRHITDLDAMDHILFLLALAAIYRLRDWRSVAWVVTAFTVGHSVTLGLAVTGMISLPDRLIEFLIPLTIVATCVENILLARRREMEQKGHHRPVFAGVFGLVHGAGFANYLRDVFGGSVAVPLVGFNVGIEVGQIVVLAAIATGLVVVDRVIAVSRRSVLQSALRIRVVSLSTVILVVAARWTVERNPW